MILFLSLKSEEYIVLMGILRAFILFFSLIFSTGIFSQCINADFETGNFTGWQGSTGDCCPIVLPNNGIINGRQTIMGPGFDGNTCGGLSRVYSGNFSARLGNSNIGAEAEGLSFTFVVSPSGSLIRYAYAVVFENPNHVSSDQPRFSSRVTLSNGNTIPCTEYTVNADSNLVGWQSCPSVDNNGNIIDIVWRDWSEVTVDLSAYVGQTVTLEFETGDCSLGGHFGYAYLDAIYCMDNSIVVDYCEGDSISTLTAPDGFETYFWENGDTTQSVTINPNLWDSILCDVTTTTGCELTLISQIDPTTVSSNFTYIGQCGGTFEFTNMSLSSEEILSYHWIFGDGTTSNLQDPIHTFSPGHWTISLTTTSVRGCVDVYLQEIDVYPIPISDFISNDVCLGYESNFTNLSTVIPGYDLNFIWIFDENGSTSNLNSPSYTYLNSGTYNVSLISTVVGSLCSDTITKTINVRANPIANFIPQNGCEGDSSLFINDSNLPIWSTNQYIWSFGDDSTSTSPLDSVYHLYSGYGNYQVSLQILSSDGNIICESTYTDEILIHPNPISNFTFENGCIYSDIQFTNLSTISDGQISNNWNFGNDSTSNVSNPSESYYESGIFEINLSVISDLGCFSTHQDTIEIYPLPIVVSSSDTICLGDSTILDAHGASTYTWDPINTLQNWNTPSVIANPTTTTVYTVIGVDTNGCSSVSQSLVFVNSNPQISSTSGSICEGDSLVLESFGGVDYTWSPVTGLNQSTGPNVTSTVTSLISYTVIGVDTNGCIGYSTSFVNVFPKPIVVVNSDSICEGQSTQLNANGAFNYIWSPSTSLNTSIGSQVISTPTSDIIYTVIGTTQDNCSDTAQSTVIVYPLSNVSFSMSDTSGCPPLVISFTDNSTQNISSWIWDFGDGYFSSEENPTHTYSNSGSYLVDLQITTNNNCISMNLSPANVLVYNTPIASFEVSSTQLTEFDPQVEIDNTSIGGYLYHWNFGDGSYSSDYNPIFHTFNQPGIYQITLNIENNLGCLDSTFRTIDIDPVFAFYIPNSFTPDNDGINDRFFGKGIGYTSVKMQIFNRWGELIFDQSSDSGPEFSEPYWDGELNDIDCQIDVYVYQFLVTDIFQQPHLYRGRVTLVR